MKRSSSRSAIIALSLFISTFFSVAQAAGQPNSYSRYRVDEATGAVTYASFQENKRPDYMLEGKNWLRELLKMRSEDELVLMNSWKDKLGYVHYRYSQTYKGLPVAFSMYIMHTLDGKIVSANGHYLPNINIDVTAGISEADALVKAKSTIDAKKYMWEIAGEEELLKKQMNDPSATYFPKGIKTILYDRTTGRNRLTYCFDIYAQQPLSRDYVYIDANDGHLIRKISRLHDVDKDVLVHTRYSGFQIITTDYSSSGYKLSEAKRGNGIATFNLMNSNDYFNAQDFVDQEESWNSLDNIDQYALDAQFGAETTYDYYKAVHNRNSIDDNGFALYNYVHYENGFGNAFWDGSRMTYGDGDMGTFKAPLTTLDICAHEITHGLTQFTAGLMDGEAGALNESFSDIFAVLIEKYKMPDITDANNYLIGEQVANGGIRNLANPNTHGNPDTYGGTFWQAWGDPHRNGMVQSFWFYILVNGKAGKNDLGNTFDVNGIGRDEAGEIVYRSLTTYLTPSANFEDAREGSIQAAIDLYGECSDEVKQTTNAWYAVGVGDPYASQVKASYTYTRDICTTPSVYRFQSTSTSVSNVRWDFGDNTYSTDVNTSHTYAKNGVYTLKLVAQGCSGDYDSVVSKDEIVVNNNRLCETQVMPSNGINTVTGCEGFLYDDGGEDAAYSAGAHGTTVIKAPEGRKVRISFLDLELGPFTDRLLLFDGPDTLSSMIGVYFAGSTPPPSITSTGNALCLQLITDQYTDLDGKGFKAGWQCTGNDPLPKPSPAPGGESIRIYPNPSAGLFGLDMHFTEEKDVSISIYNLLGKLMYQGTKKGVLSEKLDIDMSTEAQGLYIIDMMIGLERHTEKLQLVK